MPSEDPIGEATAPRAVGPSAQPGGWRRLHPDDSISWVVMPQVVERIKAFAREEPGGEPPTLITDYWIHYLTEAIKPEQCGIAVWARIEQDLRVTGHLVVEAGVAHGVRHLAIYEWASDPGYPFDPAAYRSLWVEVVAWGRKLGCREIQAQVRSAAVARLARRLCGLCVLEGRLSMRLELTSDAPPTPQPGVLERVRRARAERQTVAPQPGRVTGGPSTSNGARLEGAPDVQVVVITHCRRLELLYGSTLVFRTLRTGFPTAKITVVENGSIEAARPAIARLAEQAGCTFQQTPSPLGHGELLEHHLANLSGSRWVVVVDPDVVFWASMEAWKPDGLMAGRFIPRHLDPRIGAVAEPRLHPSLLWIDLDGVRKALVEDAGVYKLFFCPLRPFGQWLVRDAGEWRFWDTGSSLFAMLKDRCVSFEEAQLECYDHIFCGCHVDIVRPQLGGADGAELERLHRAAAQGDLEALRGCWRTQERMFERLAAMKEHNE